MQHMQDTDQQQFQVDGTRPDTHGEASTFVLRRVPQRRALGKKHIEELTLQFFGMMFKGEAVEDIQRVARGAAEYIWEHRATDQVLRLERKLTNPPKRVRSEEEYAKERTRKRSLRVRQAPEDIPRTRQDFLKVPFVHQLTQEK